MGAITGRERIEACFRGEYLDRVPVYMSYAVSECICSKLGYTRSEILTDPEKELKALQLSQKEFPSDLIRMPADPMLPDTAAARNELSKNRDGGHKSMRLENLSDLEGIPIRDPRESKTYKPYLDMVGRVKNLFPDHPVVSMCPGVFSSAAGMRGPERIIYDTVDNPDLVHGLMRFTIEMSKTRGEALVEAGTDMMVFGDPSAGCSFLSPGIYREFVKPYHDELVTHFKSNTDVLIGFHICGLTDPIMEDIAGYSLDWFEIDAPSSLEKMKALSGNKMTIRGNVPTEIFPQGTEEDMRTAVQACIEKGAPGGRYILGPGCAIPWGAKPENVRAYLESAYRYGSKDSLREVAVSANSVSLVRSVAALFKALNTSIDAPRSKLRRILDCKEFCQSYSLANRPVLQQSCEECARFSVQLNRAFGEGHSLRPSPIRNSLTHFDASGYSLNSILRQTINITLFG